MSKEYIKNWFSNMIPFEDPLIHNGIKYLSVENFYQAMKSVDLKDHYYISTLSPFQSKKEGRKLKVRPDFGDLKLDFMRFALRHKFRADTKFGKKLLETGDEEIVEYNNWNDEFWGVNIENNKGENHLGKILMEIRNELKTEKLLNESC